MMHFVPLPLPLPLPPIQETESHDLEQGLLFESPKPQKTWRTIAGGALVFVLLIGLILAVIFGLKAAF